jgi:transcriptional regulator with XRE-family HTH domain
MAQSGRYGANLRTVAMPGLSVPCLPVLSPPMRIFQSVPNGTPERSAISINWPRLSGSRRARISSAVGMTELSMTPSVPYTERLHNLFRHTSEAIVRPVPRDCKQILWKNVRALMMKTWGEENLRQLARDAGIGTGTAKRIKDQETSVGVDVLERIARLFKVEPWQLIAEDVETGPDLSPKALDVAMWFDALPPEHQPRAFTINYEISRGRWPDDAPPPRAPEPTAAPRKTVKS